MRMLSPDDACVGVTALSGRKYSGARFEVSNPGDVRALRRAGYTVADIGGGPVSGGAGFECRVCQFRSYFKRCSRCGGVCERPNLTA